jgi:Spy/CpxP family protein refolding chaperone
MKLRSLTFAVAGLVLAAGSALAQPYGMGPGMMGYGMGMGGGMGGWGWGGDGYGMGGPGMRWDNDAYAGLDLSADQRKKIAEIQRENAKASWALMGKMHEQGYHMHGMFGPAPLDEAAARKAYQAMTETHKAMFDLRLEARKKIDAVLTPEQREQLRRHWGNR